MMNKRDCEEEMDDWSEHFESENQDANYVLRFFMNVFFLILTQAREINERRGK